MLTILLQQSAAGGLGQLIPFLLIGIVFYFFMIRPQMKKNKELKKFRESLAKGDKVITIGGIHGKIEEIKDDTVVITVEGGSKLRVEKSALTAEFTPKA